MKILQVSNFFKPSWETGGVTRVNYDLSKNLVALGHDVTVYTTDGFISRLDVPTNEPVNIDGIRVYYFYTLSRVLTKKMKFPIPYYLPFVIRKEIKNYDIIHIHEHRTLLAAFVFYYAKKNGIPYVLQAHGSVLPFFQKKMFKKIFDLCVGYNILKNATSVIAVAENEVKQYIQMGVEESKIHIISNGLNIDEFKNLPIKNEFRKENSIAESEKIILYLGRIDKIKGIDLLIDSFSELKKSIDNVILVIVGPNSSYLTTLKKQTINVGINDSVLFTGPLYERDKLKAFVDADIYVLPSRYEIFGNTLLEAAACGTYVIATDRCGISEKVDGKIGMVIQFNKDELKNSLYHFLTQNRFNKDINKERIKYIVQNFDWRIIAKEIETTYDECLINNKI